MEYIPGGDIFSLLQNIGSLSEEDTKTYTIQIVKALQFLRANGIIHRDLKPDNILITAQGFLKLADFGLSYFGVAGQHIKHEETGPKASSSVVGTPDYMAPEIVLSKSHTYAADYWSLGAMVFEMLTGIPPFHGNDEMDTFRRILIGAACWEELEDVSQEAVDFLHQLLIVNPEKRLGYKSIKQIMKHPWFNGVDWENVENLKPVFIPDTSRTDSYKDYFQDRYEFQKKDENDIIEDMKFAELKNNHDDYSSDSVKSGRRRRYSGSDLHDEEDDDITQFPAVSFEQLKDSNVAIAQRIRQQARRASDIRMEKDEALLAARSAIRSYVSHDSIGSPLAPKTQAKSGSNTKLLLESSGTSSD